MDKNSWIASVKFFVWFLLTNPRAAIYMHKIFRKYCFLMCFKEFCAKIFPKKKRLAMKSMQIFSLAKRIFIPEMCRVVTVTKSLGCQVLKNGSNSKTAKTKNSIYKVNSWNELCLCVFGLVWFSVSVAVILFKGSVFVWVYVFLCELLCVANIKLFRYYPKYKILKIKCSSLKLTNVIATQLSFPWVEKS